MQVRRCGKRAQSESRNRAHRPAEHVLKTLRSQEHVRFSRQFHPLYALAIPAYDVLYRSHPVINSERTVRRWMR